MIKVNRTDIEIKGKESEIAGELGMIFYSLFKEFGEKKLKQMIDISLKVVIDDTKEIKKKIKQEFPKDLANMLCKLF